MSLEYCKISDIASSASVLSTHLFEAEASGASVSVSASAIASYVSPVVASSSTISALIGTISKGRIVGGRLYYSASNTTILEKIGYHFNDGVSDSWVETSANTSITPAMTNFPAASSWSFICGDASGNITLEAATGNYNQRPTNNEFQLTGGSVGYDDIGKNGYYINGKRILRAIHKITTTSFYFIILKNETDEYGKNYNGNWEFINRKYKEYGRLNWLSATASLGVVFPVALSSTSYSIVGTGENINAASDTYTFFSARDTASAVGYLRGAGSTTLCYLNWKLEEL